MKKRLDPKGEKIADYAWLDKTQRSWHLWLGNPFCASLCIIPLKKKSKKSIIKETIIGQRKEKKRFSKLFPGIKW